MFELHLLAPASDATGELEFAIGLRDCYRHFGVDAAVNLLTPSQRPYVWHVVVRDEDQRMVGGARIHHAGPSCPLPALRALDGKPALRAAMVRDASRLGPPVELAALWVERTRKELRGLGRLVAQASIAVARNAGLARAVTFSHDTLDTLLTSIGMRPVPGAPPIPYPDARYRSTIYDVDPRAPVDATAADRAQIETIADAFRHSTSIDVVAAPTSESNSLAWQVVAPVPATAAA